MYLLVNAAGKYWRYDYRYMGRRKTLALGIYPTVAQEDARAVHQQARRDLEQHLLDPAEHLSKKARRLAHTATITSTVEAVCREWLLLQTQWAESHRVKVQLRLENDVYPVLGARELSTVTAPDVLRCRIPAHP